MKGKRKIYINESSSKKEKRVIYKIRKTGKKDKLQKKVKIVWLLFSFFAASSKMTSLLKEDLACPFDIECKFKKSALLVLKNPEYGYLSGKHFYAFNIPGLQYHVRIYPNGFNETSRGDVMISLNVKDSEGRRISARCTIYIESADFSKTFYYLYGTFSGWGNSCCKSAEFFDSMNDYFIDGEVTVRIQGILKAQRPSVSKICCPISMQWSIKETDLKAKKESTDGRLKSKRKIVSSSKIRYYLSIYPCVTRDGTTKTEMFLNVDMGKSKKKIDAIFDFSVGSANFNYGMQLVFNKSQAHGTHICLSEDLFDPLKGYIVDGFLTINFNGIFLMESAQNTVLKFKKGVASQCTQTENDKDFTIHVGDKEIKVHKQVLMEASEYFIGMFESGMMESIQNKMIIKEFPFETIEAGINLLYGNSVPKSFELEDMLSLYQFADKYHIQLIMDSVENYLIKQISPSNVCHLEKFSACFNVTKLRQKCINFLHQCSKKCTPVYALDTLNRDLAFEMFLSTFQPIANTDNNA